MKGGIITQGSHVGGVLHKRSMDECQVIEKFTKTYNERGYTFW